MAYQSSIPHAELVRARQGASRQIGASVPTVDGSAGAAKVSSRRWANSQGLPQAGFSDSVFAQLRRDEPGGVDQWMSKYATTGMYHHEFASPPPEKPMSSGDVA